MNKAAPGCLLIVASWAIAFVVLVAFPLSEHQSWWQNVALVLGMSIAGLFYTAGVISWAIFGAVSRDLENIQKQNKEMIDLLRRIADAGHESSSPPSPVEVTLPAPLPIAPGSSQAITRHPRPSAPTDSSPASGGVFRPEELGHE